MLSTPNGAPARRSSRFDLKLWVLSFQASGFEVGLGRTTALCRTQTYVNLASFRAAALVPSPRECILWAWLHGTQDLIVRDQYSRREIDDREPSCEKAEL